MKTFENRIKVKQRKSSLMVNLDYIDINNKNQIYDTNNNGLNNRISLLRKNKIEKTKLNKDINDDGITHASRNKINFSFFNPYEKKSNNNQKYYTLNNFNNLMISKSREKICFSSSSKFKMQRANPKEKIKDTQNKTESKTIDTLYMKNIISKIEKKQKSINQISELVDKDKEYPTINFDFKENKQVKKLKYITPFHLKDLLTKENKEIKNPFLDTILYPTDRYFEKKELIGSFSSKNPDKVEKNYIKLSNNEEKSLINENTLKNSLDKPIFEDNSLKEKSNLKIEENSLKIYPENKSSGVQCAFDVNADDPAINMTYVSNDYKKKTTLNCNKIIRNAEIRENISLEKSKKMMEDNKNILNINIYNTQMTGVIEELYGNKFHNKNSIKHKKKPKTANYMKSTISEQNKILNLKNVTSVKNTLIKNLDDDVNYYNKYKDHKFNFKNTNEKFKNFFYIANSEEANQIKYGIEIKKKDNRKLKSIPNIENKATNQKSLANNHQNLLQNPICKGLDRRKLNKDCFSINTNQKDVKFLHIKDKSDDLLKVYFDRSINRNNGSYKKNGFIDNCNTSNGFINIGEFNFLERNSHSKNINNPSDSFLKSKENDSNLLILSINKSPKNKFDRNNDFADKNKPRSNLNLDIIKHNFEEKKNNKNEDNSNKKFFTKSSFNNFNFKSYSSKNKFKILKKERTRDNQKINFMVENFEEFK